MNRSATLDRSPEQLAPTTPSRGRGPLRRRFTLVAVGLLSVLMAVLGVNFAADSATSESSVVEKAGITVANGTVQSWNVSVGSAGTVPAPKLLAGPPAVDNFIARVDPANTTSSKMLVSVYITNLSELAVNYSSWNFNLALFSHAGGTPVYTSPPAATPTQVGTTQVMTSDSGVVSWIVDVNTAKVYTLRLEAGGSFYTISAINGTVTTNGVTTTGSLSPKFFVRATQL